MIGTILGVGGVMVNQTQEIPALNGILSSWGDTECMEVIFQYLKVTCAL
jgi:hypothetical protein